MIARYHPPLCQTVLQLPEEGLFAAAFRGMRTARLFARRKREKWTVWGNEVESIEEVEL